MSFGPAAAAPPAPKPVRSNRLEEGDDWRKLTEECFTEMMDRKAFSAHLVVDTVSNFYEDVDFDLLRELMNRHARKRVVEAFGEASGDNFDAMDLRTRLYVLLLMSGAFSRWAYESKTYGLKCANDVSQFIDYSLHEQLSEKGQSYIVRFPRQHPDHGGTYFMPDRIACDKNCIAALIAHLGLDVVADSHRKRLELRHSRLRDEMCKSRPSFFNIMVAGYRASRVVSSKAIEKYGQLQGEPELPRVLFGTHHLLVAFDDDHADYQWLPGDDEQMRRMAIRLSRYCAVPGLVDGARRREGMLAKEGGYVYSGQAAFCVHDRKSQRTGMYVEYEENGRPMVLGGNRLWRMLRAAVTEHGAVPDVSWGDMVAFFAKCPEVSNTAIATHSLHQMKLIYDHDEVVARVAGEPVEVSDAIFRPGVAEQLTELQRTTVQAAMWSRRRPVAFDSSIEIASAAGFFLRFTRGTQARLSPNRSPAPSRRSAVVVANGTGTGKTLTAMVIHAQPRDGAWKPDVAVVSDGLVKHWVDELQKHTKLNVVFGADVARGLVKPDVVVCRGVKDLPGIGTPAQNPPRDLMGMLLGAPAPKAVPATSCYGSRETAPRLTVVSHNFLRQRKTQSVLGQVEWGTAFVEEAHELTRVTMECMDSVVKREFTVCITATPYQSFKKLGHLTTGDEDYVLSRLIRQRMHCRAIEGGRIKMELHEIMCENTPEEAAFFADVKTIVDEMYESDRSDNIAQIFRMMERVTSGGRVHAELMLRRMRAIVRLAKSRKRERPAHDAPARQRNGDVFATVVAATKRAHCDRADECAVCCGDFDEPMQTNCGHVFCGACLKDMWDFNMRLCPMCNRAMNKFYAPPLFRDTVVEKPKPKPAPEPAPAPAKPAAAAAAGDGPGGVDDERMDRKQFIGMLNPAAGDVPGVLTMRGKMNAFREAYVEWSKDFAPQKQAIMFIQNDAAARAYAAAMREVNPRSSVGSAGLLGHNRAASLADIDRFKRGELNVLMVSPRYCTGFDLANATEVWILGLTLEICQAVQAVGRVYRYSQTAAAVHIRVFLNPGTFGHYMWANRHVGKFSMTRTTMLHYRIWYHNEMVPVSRDAWRACRDVPDMVDRVICVAETLLRKPLGECIYVTWRGTQVLVDFKLVLDVKKGIARVYGDNGRIIQFTRQITFRQIQFNARLPNERVNAADKLRALLAKAKVSEEHVKMMSQIEKARSSVV